MVIDQVVLVAMNGCEGAGARIDFTSRYTHAYLTNMNGRRIVKSTVVDAVQEAMHCLE